MRAVVLTITGAASIPAGEQLPLYEREKAQITSVALVVTATVPCFGNLDVGRIIYAENQVRTITKFINPSTVQIETAFDTDISAAAAFTAIKPETFHQMSLISAGTYSLCTPDSPMASIPILPNLPMVSEFTGAIAINAGAGTVVVSYGME